MRRYRSPLALLAVAALAFAAVGIVPRPGVAADADIVAVVTTTGTAVGATAAGEPRRTDLPSTCRAGYRSLGVGFSGIAAPLFFNFTSRSAAVDDVVVENYGAARAFTSYTLCLEAPAPTTYPALSRAVPPGDVRSSTVGCPSGSRRVGGGGGVGRSDEPASFLTASHPTARGWTVRVNNRAGTTTVTANDRASCVAKEGLQVRDVVATGVTARPNVRTSRQASCPVGWEIAFGGFRLPPPGGLAIEGSYPSVTPDREGWVVTVDNTTAEPVTFDVHAVCVRLA